MKATDSIVYAQGSYVVVESEHGGFYVTHMEGQHAFPVTFSTASEAMQTLAKILAHSDQLSIIQAFRERP